MVTTDTVGAKFSDQRTNTKKHGLGSREMVALNRLDGNYRSSQTNRNETMTKRRSQNVRRRVQANVRKRIQANVRRRIQANVRRRIQASIIFLVIKDIISAVINQTVVGSDKKNN